MTLRGKTSRLREEEVGSGMVTLRIDVDGSGLGYQIPNSEYVAFEFFTKNRDSVRRFDDAAMNPGGSENRFIAEDGQLLNSAMATRLSSDRFQELLALGSFPALKALRPDWDLAELTEQTWDERAPLIQQAIEEIWGPGRRAAVTTKLLHLKRPQLIPIIDPQVAWTLGWRGHTVVALVGAIGQVRSVANQNLEGLDSIRTSLFERANLRRTRVRILEAILWSLGGIDRPYDSLAEWSATYPTGPAR